MGAVRVSSYGFFPLVVLLVACIVVGCDSGGSGDEDNANPSLLLRSPQENQRFILTHPIPVSASAFDDDALARVVIYVVQRDAQGTPLNQYEEELANVRSPQAIETALTIPQTMWPDSSFAGSYILGVEATDRAGNQSSEEIAINLVAPTTRVVPGGLVAYYPFNAGANDESGHERHSCCLFTATSVAGLVGPAALFDGVTNEITIPGEHSPFPATYFTIVALVKSEGRDGQMDVLLSSEPRFQLQTEPVAAVGSQLDIRRMGSAGNPDGTEMVFYQSGNQAGGRGFASFVGQWMMVVFRVGPSDTSLQDGVLDVADASRKAFREMPAAQGSLIGGLDLHLGYSGTSLVSDPRDDHYKGLIDEVRIYDRVLSVEDLETLHAYYFNPAGS